MSDRLEDRLFATQDVIFEVETGVDLSTHTTIRLYYIPPSSGQPGAVADAVYITGTAIAGTTGNSVNKGALIENLAIGPYVFWSESDNSGGQHFVSPAKEALVEQRGTIRR